MPKLSALYSWLSPLGVAATFIGAATISFASLSPPGSAGDPGSADKAMHIIAYAIIVLPLALVRSRTRIWSAVGILIWSGCIELLQPLFGRSSSVSDVIANASGILLGLSLAVFLSRFFPTPTK